jgi:LPS export ABC transporter protein LptC
MKKLIVSLAVIGVLAAGIWFALRGTGAAPALAAEEIEGDRFDFEAQQVLMRQMDVRGKLQYEIEADRIVQMPDRGSVQATGLTLRHDPPGTEPGGPNRWTLNAAEGELPADGRIVTLKGDVRAEGVPEGRSLPLRLQTQSLSMDLDSQEIYTDDVVDTVRGSMKMRGKGLRANVATGELSLESGYATISSRP